MEALRTYLNLLCRSDQEAFASRCGTSIGYLRKAISKGQRFDAELCINIDRESKGEVSAESLRPDVDWAYVHSKRPPSMSEAAP